MNTNTTEEEYNEYLKMFRAKMEDMFYNRFGPTKNNEFMGKELRFYPGQTPLGYVHMSAYALLENARKSILTHNPDVKHVTYMRLKEEFGRASRKHNPVTGEVKYQRQSLRMGYAFVFAMLDKIQGTDTEKK